MIENTVDPATGTVTVRATMPNADELLWPGTLVQRAADLPRGGGRRGASTAIQVSQSGPFVFVVKNGVATVQPVKMARVYAKPDSVGKSALKATRPW